MGSNMDWETEEAWTKAQKQLIKDRTGSLAAYDLDCLCPDCNWARVVLKLTNKIVEISNAKNISP